MTIDINMFNVTQNPVFLIIVSDKNINDYPYLCSDDFCAGFCGAASGLGIFFRSSNNHCLFNSSIRCMFFSSLFM